MSYLVMARKWRPRNFDEMVGQEHIARTLRNAIESDRVSHAFLFTGTRGVGKTTSARILAKALNCKNGPTATPCEKCDNCLAVNRGQAMDVLEIDGASNNGVEDIRELREQVAYAPMQGKYKIYIIDEVHMLTKSAFNALLKTLEEPPPHVVFIFATTESAKVPHTILSRVQRFDFKRISETAIRERLEYICGQEGVKPERAALEVIARKADGSMRDALSLFDRVYAFAGNDLTLDAARKALGIPAERLYDDLLARVAGHDAGGGLAVLAEVYEEGLDVSEFLVGFGEYLRDHLFARQRGVTPELLGLSADRFAELRTLAGDLQDGDLLRYAKIVSDLVAGLKTAPHPRLWVELGLARMAALDRVVTLAQLMGQAPGPLGASPASSQAPTADKKKNPELTPARGIDREASGNVATEPVPDEHPATAPEAPPLLFEEAPPPAESLDPVTTNETPPAPATDVPETGPTEDLKDDADSEYEGFIAGEASFGNGLSTQAGVATLSSVIASGSSRPLAAAEVPDRWADLVEDYAIDRPFTSSPLRHSRVDLKDGDPVTLDVTFAGAHYLDLFLSDGENRKSLREFLSSRLEPGIQYTLAFSTTLPANGSSDGGDAVAPIRTIHPAASAEAMLEEEPGLRRLIEVFEGRMID